jgi:aryl-alcohol dehydrogenase-like predicted oxidoreductase
LKNTFFGNTGLKVSELCLGCMTFGRESSKSLSFQMMDTFYEQGGNFFDTADVYGRGASERILGEWLKDKPREHLVIATKVRGAMGDEPNNVGLSRKHILASVEASLERLGLDYIDLYQVHMWDSATPLEETLRTLNQLVMSGKVRYIGASNFSGWQLQKAVDLSRQHGLEQFVSLQPLYNLLDRELEWELLPLCLNEGLATMIWSPLRGGWLSGKYSQDMEAPPEDTRVKKASEQGWSESWNAYANERTWRILDALRNIANELDRSVAQISLRWLMQRPGVTVPIIGASKMRHLKDNLGAADFELSEEHMATLNEVSEPNYPYPYGFIRNRE